MAYQKEASNADNEAGNRGGRWLSIKGGDLVLHLFEGQALQRGRLSDAYE